MAYCETIVLNAEDKTHAPPMPILTGKIFRVTAESALADNCRKLVMVRNANGTTLMIINY